MGQGEVCLEICPNFVGVILALPGFAIIQEHAGCKEDLKGGGKNLGGGIGSISDGSIVKGVFDLIEEAFDWVIWIVGGLEVDVVVLEVGYADTIVIGVYMIKDVANVHVSSRRTWFGGSVQKFFLQRQEAFS